MKTKETSNKVTCNQCGKQKTGSIEGICEHCGKFGNVKSTRELTGREIEEIWRKENINLWKTKQYIFNHQE